MTRSRKVCRSLPPSIPTMRSSGRAEACATSASSRSRRWPSSSTSSSSTTRSAAAPRRPAAARSAAALPGEFFAMLARESVGPSTDPMTMATAFGACRPTRPRRSQAIDRIFSQRSVSTGRREPSPRSSNSAKAARKAGKWLGAAGVQSDAACLVAKSCRQSRLTDLARFRRRAARLTYSRRRSTISRDCDRSATPSRPIATRSGPMTRCRPETISSMCPSASAIRTIPASA